MARSARTTLALALAGLLAGTALSACGGSSSDDGGKAGGTATPSASGTASPTAGASAYLPVPSGVSLTSPGTALQVGQSATVAWQPSQKVTGVLDVTVTGLQSTTFDTSFSGWELDEATKANAPYFVTATVRNAGESDLGGQAVPLYGTAETGALVEASTFATNFKPCHPGVLPTPFPAGASVDVCLVYLVPNAGALAGVSFRPTQSFDPITWTGEVTPLPGATTSPAGSPAGSSKASPSVHMSGSPAR